jgi:hypothetical protein
MLCMNSVYVYLLLNSMYELCVCMLLDADYVFFQLNANCIFVQLNADCVFFQKLNVDYIFYLAVTDELTSACPSLLDPW